MVQRNNHPEDLAFIDRVLKEEEVKEEALSHSAPAVSASAVLDSVTSKLDDFLNMIEGDDDEENLVRTMSSRGQTRTITPPFTCALCHSSETDSLDLTPMLLCHIDNDRLPGRFFLPI